MSANIKAIVAVSIGVASIAALIAADVQGWSMSAVSAGLLGTLVGFVPGYLAPSPLERRK